MNEQLEVKRSVIHASREKPDCVADLDERGVWHFTNTKTGESVACPFCIVLCDVVHDWVYHDTVGYTDPLTYLRICRKCGAGGFTEEKPTGVVKPGEFQSVREDLAKTMEHVRLNSTLRIWG